MSGACAATQETLIVNDAANDDRFDASVDKQTGFTTKSLMCMPLVDNCGACVAVIQLLNKGGPHADGAFTDEDEMFLQLYARQAAVSLRNAALVDDLAHVEDGLKKVFGALVELTSEPRRLAARLGVVCDAARVCLGAQHVRCLRQPRVALHEERAPRRRGWRERPERVAVRESHGEVHVLEELHRERGRSLEQRRRRRRGRDQLHAQAHRTARLQSGGAD